MRSRLVTVFCMLFLGATLGYAQDTTITHHLLPKYVGGSPTSVTTLEQPIAVYFTFSGLEPNTDYNQAHMGFLTKGTTSVRGSKWTVNGWISPSTVLFYKKSDAQGNVTGWAFLRTPSSYLVGVDTAQIRLRLQKVGTSTNITFDSQPLTSLNISDTATGSRAGAIVYGYVDTVATTYAGNIVVAYGDTGTRPLSAWYILPSRTQWTTDFFTTRMDTVLRRAGYFQLVVPANQKIGKIEVRDTLNTVVKTWTSTQWTAGGAGSKTEINFALASVRREDGVSPDRYMLEQNFPNPFNPSTQIRFSLKRPGFVSLKIYDMLGKEVTTLVNQDLTGGTYTAQWNAEHVPSGIYFYTVTAGQFTETKKMLLIK